MTGVKYPCISCQKAVAKNHKAICCDSCNKWIHIKCNYIDKKTYINLQRSNSSWFCINCIKKIIPFSNLSDDELKKITEGSNTAVIPVPIRMHKN